MYLVLKTTNDKIVQMGSVFEAVRGHWVLDPEHAQQCSHVVAVVDKQVKEVFALDKIYKSTLCGGRYVFAGETDIDLTNKLRGKEISSELCIKGAENPVRYVEEDELFSTSALAEV